MDNQRTLVLRIPIWLISRLQAVEEIEKQYNYQAVVSPLYGITRQEENL